VDDIDELCNIINGDKKKRGRPKALQKDESPPPAFKEYNEPTNNLQSVSTLSSDDEES
jgi:hypothetical protein